MADARMVELLQAFLSSDNAARKQAETMYQQAKTENPTSLLLGFSGVLADQAVPEAVRAHSAVMLRQLVTKRSDKDFPWAKVAPETKQQFAKEMLGRFEASPDANLQKKIREIIAKLAEATSDQSDQNGWFAAGQRGWPDLLNFVFRLANPATNPNAQLCEAAVRLLKDCVSVFPQEIAAAQQQLGACVQGSLAHAEPKVKCAAFCLVSELVTELETKAWAPLTATASVLTAILKQLAQAGLEDEVEECMQNYLEIASVAPDFFKQQLTSSMEPATLLATLVKTREGVKEGVRTLALEWLVTYITTKPKWVAKSMPQLAALGLECCMDLMLEIEDGPEALQEWAERMDDEEGEEDSDELYHVGEEAIDRIVEAMEMDKVGAALFALIGRFSKQDPWQAKLTALTAIKQTVEYAEEQSHISEMAQLLLAHVDHPHPRVRYTALHAIGQLSHDQAPTFQDNSYKTVMPMLLRKFGDDVARVSSMAMSAFVSFGEELENALMMQYAPQFMEALVNILKTSNHRMVQEESITSIAVIAGVMEKEFSQYYDSIMPFLKAILMKPKEEKDNRLRGKAFECISLLGAAVGKEKFLNDAKEAVLEMLKTQSTSEADDLQREYMKEAMERICKCLGKDFVMFLEHVLPNLFKQLSFEAEDAGNKDDDEDAYVTVSTGDGKLLKVHSSKFEEMMQAIQLLNVYCNEIEGAFFDYVPRCAQALLPILSATDEVSMLCEDARGEAFQTWASLIKVARTGCQERGQPLTIVSELLTQFLKCANNFFTGSSQDDAEALASVADGLSECIKNAGAGALGAQEVTSITTMLFQQIDASFLRSENMKKEKEKNALGAPEELQADEDDEANEVEDEETCRRNLEDAIGSVMKVSPAEFAQVLQLCSQKLSVWLANKQCKTVGLFLACDLLEHLGAASEQLWPVFMQHIFSGLTDADADVKIPAAYAVALAAPLPNFAVAAPQAFNTMAQIVSGPAPKKRDAQGKIAMDNCVAALFALARHQEAQCPANVPAWKLVVAKLPLKNDEDEAKKIHKAACEMLLSQHAGLMGPDNANISQILSALAEAYKQENLCEKETDEMIRRIFRMLPRENLMQLAGGFTEKQQKKIEKMLSDAQA